MDVGASVKLNGISKTEVTYMLVWLGFQLGFQALGETGHLWNVITKGLPNWGRSQLEGAG